MITFLFALSLACGAPEQPILADHEIRQALDGNLPMNRAAIVETFGSHRVEWFPIEPSTDGTTSYRVWVDPMYDHTCFEQRVAETLSDERSWPNLRLAGENEVPQFWVTLVAPGATCAHAEIINLSCANSNNQVIRINSLRWMRGSGRLPLNDDRNHIVNHEVGHILGHGHEGCGSVMAPFYQVPEECSLEAWPTLQDLG
jgi:hypothetical protein